MLTNNTPFDWTVIGAGPAGIAAVGKLLDNKIAPHKIAWIDPLFSVGDFGTKWRKVPSNTKVSLFLDFLSACKSFNYNKCPEHFALHDCGPDETCELSMMADPLYWVTSQLQQQVNAIPAFVAKMGMEHCQWQITLTNNAVVHSKNVILATGSEPKSLAFAELETISLPTALDTDRLSESCNENDTVAVFGSSHSAILILRNLLEYCSVKKVINFYQGPLRYAFEHDGEILFDNTGLKGNTATWARANIHGKLPEKLERIHSSEVNIQKYIPQCSKGIYAIGFQKRTFPIEGLAELNYNSNNGIIAPGLFGLGIAFPQSKIDRFGTLEYSVGLWKFMTYLSTILPVWLHYPA